MAGIRSQMSASKIWNFPQEKRAAGGVLNLKIAPYKHCRLLLGLFRQCFSLRYWEGGLGFFRPCVHYVDFALGCSDFDIFRKNGNINVEINAKYKSDIYKMYFPFLIHFWRIWSPGSHQVATRSTTKKHGGVPKNTQFDVDFESVEKVRRGLNQKSYQPNLW
jgi:hypothetical protein